MPFNPESIDQFCALEQPEADWEAEQLAEYRAAALPLDRLSDICSSERNYSTVGELYRGIQDGFRYLAQKLGEAELFVGPRDAQVAEPYVQMPGLFAVYDLETALAAIKALSAAPDGGGPSSEDHAATKDALERTCQELIAVRTLSPARPPARPHSVAARCTAMRPWVNGARRLAPLPG